MEIKLDLPDNLVRKIKALHVLSGGASSDFSSVLTGLMDEVVSDKIAALLGIGSPSVSRTVVGAELDPPATYQPPPPRDVSGLSAGLGDADDAGDYDDPETLPPASMDEMIPTGGLTDEMLEHDLDVDDPEHEAASVAPVDPSTYKEPAESLFASSLSSDPPEGAIRARRQRPPSKSRGKAVPLTNFPTD